MKRRALVTLIAAVAAIVAAVAYARSGVAIVPGLVMVVFAMLGALPAEMTPELAPAARQEVPPEVFREGAVVRSLGRMLELDLSAYGSLLSKGLAAAR